MFNCCFCDIANGISEEEYDKVIYQTENFFVITSLGAFVEGYLLVIPKKHIVSIAKLGQKQISELESIKEKINMLYKKYYNTNAIIFENGNCSNKGLFKDSISHAHLHFVPNLKNKNYFKEIFGNVEYIKMQNYSQLKNYKNNSYIFYQYDENNLYITIERKKFHRQHIRNIIAKDFGNIEYNWRKEGYIQLCVETIKKFIKYFDNKNI